MMNKRNIVTSPCDQYRILIPTLMYKSLFLALIFFRPIRENLRRVVDSTQGLATIFLLFIIFHIIYDYTIDSIIIYNMINDE